MTREEKVTIAQFLDLSADFLVNGHTRNRPAILPEDFADSESDTNPDESASGEAVSSFPLAYTISESDTESDDEQEYADETAAAYDIQVQEQNKKYNDTLEQIAEEIKNCKACGLCATRKNAVPGEGAKRPLVMVIGEGPGADEDASGRPFVGKAGQLLDKMLKAIDLYRDKNCFIANIVKCRPPGNRDPQPDEASACIPYLQRQIKILKPHLILCAGRIASQNLLKTTQGVNALRGTFHEYRINTADEVPSVIPVICTLHPSAILRDSTNRAPAWEDLKQLKAKLVSICGEYFAEE